MGGTFESVLRQRSLGMITGLLPPLIWRITKPTPSASYLVEKISRLRRVIVRSDFLQMAKLFLNRPLLILDVSFTINNYYHTRFMDVVIFLSSSSFYFCFLFVTIFHITRTNDVNVNLLDDNIYGVFVISKKNTRSDICLIENYGVYIQNLLIMFVISWSFERVVKLCRYRYVHMRINYSNWSYDRYNTRY